MREHAQNYHRERKGNCAQSVAHAWMEKHTDSRDLLTAFSGCGGGRAPEGLCGALHASCTLAGPSAAKEIKERFAEQTGNHQTCREIRRAGVLSCNECVAVAAELLDKHADRPVQDQQDEAQALPE